MLIICDHFHKSITIAWLLMVNSYQEKYCLSILYGKKNINISNLDYLEILFPPFETYGTFENMRINNQFWQSHVPTF